MSRFALDDDGGDRGDEERGLGENCLTNERVERNEKEKRRRGGLRDSGLSSRTLMGE